MARDYAAAAAWFAKAAAQGSSGAQCNLGNYYALGRGVTAGAARAVALLVQATAQGENCARANLASALSSGRGIQLAAQWYFKSAVQGNAHAQTDLGAFFYERGARGLTKDTRRAAAWFIKAAAQGFVRAENNMGILYHTGAIFEDELNAGFGLSDCSGARATFFVLQSRRKGPRKSAGFHGVSLHVRQRRRRGGHARRRLVVWQGRSAGL